MPTKTYLVHHIRQFINTHSIACACDSDQLVLLDYKTKLEALQSSLKPQELILRVGCVMKKFGGEIMDRSLIGDGFSGSFWRTWRSASLDQPHHTLEDWHLLPANQQPWNQHQTALKILAIIARLVVSNPLQAYSSLFIIEATIPEFTFFLNKSWLS